MATTGQILVNPETGNTFEFIETAQDTNGARVTIKTTIKSKGELVANHLHLLQDETFEVISGRLTIIRNGQLHTLEAGEKITLPKNQPHNHYNQDDSPVTYIQTTTPALDFEHLIETLVGLATDGKLKNGKAGLVQELVILKYLDSKAYLSGIPLRVQDVLKNVVAPVGRALGFRAVYKQYSGFEK